MPSLNDTLSQLREQAVSARSDSAPLRPLADAAKQGPATFMAAHETQAMERRRQQLLQDKRDEEFGAQMKEQVEEIRSAYLYGLNTVSQLTTLADAPENTLPGNFPSDKR